LDGLRRALVQGLDEGQLVTHFVGHGGRFEWRIAAPDLERQTDLFTLDDLETLTPTETPTLVLSIACHSAPFDHPSADSIGEGFLRLPGRGAVGVVAASWRNAPGPELSDALMTELLSAPTVGEAVLRAKRRLVDRELVATYNLLGDPALPPARPQRTAKVERLPVSNDGGTAVRVVFPDEALGGRAVVDWLDEKGVPVVEQLIEHVVAIEDFEAPTAARALRVYFWNEENGTDGLVGLDLQTEPSRVTAIRP
jgi:hypothetical protein